MRIQFDHLQPTPVGAEVVAEAVLEKIDGRRLKFTVSASDPGGLVAAGKITRVVVDLDRFMSQVLRHLIRRTVTSGPAPDDRSGEVAGAGVDVAGVGEHVDEVRHAAGERPVERRADLAR